MDSSHFMIRLVCMAILLFHFTDSRGVCYKRYVRSHGRSMYHTIYHGRSIRYSYNCGWWGWNRCNGYRYVTYSSPFWYFTGDTYGSQSFCCGGYSGAAPNCYAICNPSCVNGYCTTPNHCTCNAGWIGGTCRDDLNLKYWCNSVKNHRINNYYQTRVWSNNHKVFCDATTSSFIWYDQSKMNYVAPRIKADSDRCTADYNRPALYEFWKQHPNVRGHCCISNTNYHITLLTSIINFDTNFYQLVRCLTSDVAIELRKELNNLCSSSLSDAFCPIKAALDVIDITAKLPANKWTWTTQTNDFKTAIFVHFAIMKRNNPTIFSSIVIDEDKVILDCIEVILKAFNNKNIKKVKELEPYLPANGALKNSDGTCKIDHLCLLMKIIEQVRLYIDGSDADTNAALTSGEMHFTLNTAVDYREFLKQKQLDRILTVLAELKTSSVQIANDLKKHSTTQFTELRTYFETIETFNKQIAAADIGYIDGRLTMYQDSVDGIVGVMKRDMAYLLSATFAAATVNVVEKYIIKAMEIAASFNPFKWFTDGTSAKDILLAAADFVNAIADTIKVGAISVAFINLQFKTVDFAKKIEKNDAFLQNVKDIIDYELKYDKVSREEFSMARNKFLKGYNDYAPQITTPEIEEIGALWEVLIETTCDVLNGFDSAVAAPFKSLVYVGGYCTSLIKDLAKLVSTYEEIYDFQFDLMDAMASYVRSSVALDAANEINTEFTEISELDLASTTTFTTLQIMGGLTYVAYTAHIVKTVHLYCNVLEYMERGIRPDVCKGMNTNIALLLANRPPICTSSTLQFYHVPTVGGPSNSIIDIEDLFAGKEISFKIPSSDWLVENDWIHESEKDYSMYVKRFEVYLPVKTEALHKLISTAIPTTGNEVTPGPDSRKYSLVPSPRMVYEYMIGPSRLYCHDPKIKNPYATCEINDVSEICELTLNNNQNLYPSIYSQWAITVKGGEEFPVPKSTTNMTIIFGMQLCKVAPQYENIAVIQEAFIQDEQCCSDGEYRPKFNGAECQLCPNGSTSALAGYYCEEELSFV